MESKSQKSDSLVIRLHDAARHYCIERHTFWCKEYERIRTAGRDGSVEYKYSEQDKKTFPRYNVLAAILEEVEKINPDTILTLNEAREFFTLAGQCGENNFTKPPNDDLVKATMDEERNSFSKFISEISDEQITQTPPLFYRHVLSDVENQSVRQQLKEYWGVDGGYYFPLKDECPQNSEAFVADAFETAVSIENLRRELAQRNIIRVFEIREYGPNYEMELSVFEPFYNGAEGFWTAQNYDWLIYASHESSITIAGDWLLDYVKSIWPDWKKKLWSLNYC
jgi:hypothetical protein